MNDYQYTPKDVEELTGLSTLSQRERRLQRELKLKGELRLQAHSFYFSGQEIEAEKQMDEFGKQQSNKRWMFTRKDLIGIGVAKLLEKYVPERFEAERMAHWIAPQVAYALGLTGPDFFFAPGLVGRTGANDVYVDGTFRVGKPLTYGFFVRGQNPIFSDDASRVTDFDDPCVYVVKIKELAKQLPEKLVQRIKIQNI